MLDPETEQALLRRAAAIAAAAAPLADPAVATAVASGSTEGSDVEMRAKCQRALEQELVMLRERTRSAEGFLARVRSEQLPPDVLKVVTEMSEMSTSGSALRTQTLEALTSAARRGEARTAEQAFDVSFSSVDSRVDTLTDELVEERAAQEELKTELSIEKSKHFVAKDAYVESHRDLR